MDFDQWLLSEIFASASITAMLTPAQREGIKSCLLKNQLDAEEVASINRILRAIRQGLIKMV
jgi:hypothetical protein